MGHRSRRPLGGRRAASSRQRQGSQAHPRAGSPPPPRATCRGCGPSFPPAPHAASPCARTAGRQEQVGGQAASAARRHSARAVQRPCWAGGSSAAGGAGVAGQGQGCSSAAAAHVGGGEDVAPARQHRAGARGGPVLALGRPVEEDGIGEHFVALVLLPHHNARLHLHRAARAGGRGVERRCARHRRPAAGGRRAVQRRGLAGRRVLGWQGGQRGQRQGQRQGGGAPCRGAAQGGRVRGGGRGWGGAGAVSAAVCRGLVRLSGPHRGRTPARRPAGRGGVRHAAGAWRAYVWGSIGLAVVLSRSVWMCEC